jgi:integrase/recombinase XerD
MRKGQLLKTRKRAAVKPAGPAHHQIDPLAGKLLVRYMEEHFEWMTVTGYSADTVRARRQHIRKFITWIDERGIDSPTQITRPMVERYQRHLFYYRKTDGQPLSMGMQVQYLASIKLWFKWLTRTHHILANPAADLDLPRSPKRLPGRILSSQEVEAVLREADPATPQGLRDRTLLELLYATGVRRSEVASLGLYDPDLLRGVLWVRHGKGNRQRVVPLGSRAIAWLEKYLTKARPELLAGNGGEGGQALFISDYGLPMRADQIADKVRRYMDFAGIHKGGATHLLRHACATHMLEGGADIRFIQAMLGHTSLETTEIYTHVSIDKLIEVHRATHPSRLERVKAGDGPQGEAVGEVSPQAHSVDAATALLEALAGEEDEDA